MRVVSRSTCRGGTRARSDNFGFGILRNISCHWRLDFVIAVGLVGNRVHCRPPHTLLRLRTAEAGRRPINTTAPTTTERQGRPDHGGSRWTDCRAISLPARGDFAAAPARIHAGRLGQRPARGAGLGLGCDFTPASQRQPENSAAAPGPGPVPGSSTSGAAFGRGT